eukprot:1161955-Pelagomonas_calceolata.AAC.19
MQDLSALHARCKVVVCSQKSAVPALDAHAPQELHPSLNSTPLPPSTPQSQASGVLALCSSDYAHAPCLASIKSASLLTSAQIDFCLSHAGGACSAHEAAAAVVHTQLQSCTHQCDPFLPYPF